MAVSGARCSRAGSEALRRRGGVDKVGRACGLDRLAGNGRAVAPRYESRACHGSEAAHTLSPTGKVKVNWVEANVLHGGANGRGRSGLAGAGRE